MEAAKNIILSGTCAAMICGILTGLFHNNALKSIIKVICGLFIFYVFIQPILSVDLISVDALEMNYYSAVEQITDTGSQSAMHETAEIIKSRLEAYVMEKADAYNTLLKVEVFLSDDDKMIPEEISLHGNVSPYVRSRLEKEIADDLGIPKENQLWMGSK